MSYGRCINRINLFRPKCLILIHFYELNAKQSLSHIQMWRDLAVIGHSILLQQLPLSATAMQISSTDLLIEAMERRVRFQFKTF